MIDSLYQDSTDRVLDDMQARPGRAPDFKPGFWAGVASAAPRGVVSGAAKVGASQANIATAYSDVIGAFDPFGASVINRTDPEKVKAERAEAMKRIESGELGSTPIADEMRKFARQVRPDPQTTGFAGQALFGVTDFVTQAAVSSALPGGAVGGVGISEGTATYDELLQQGVDPATAAKVAAARGVVAAGTIALPVAGATWKGTAGLVAAGGPGTYVAENLAAREILKSADYSRLAETYDPFDPLGLFVATATAGLFGTGAMAMRARGAKGQVPTQDQVDAAHVVLAREVEDSHLIANPADFRADAADRVARETAEGQLAAGERVNVSDIAPVQDELPPPVREMAARMEDATVPQAKNLSAEDRAIEARLAQEVVEIEATAQRYAELRDSEGGKVLNTDVARELSPDYLADRTKSAAVHEPASWFIKRLYEKKLAEAPKGDEAPQVMFTAGGTGAGKTSAIDTLPAMKTLKDSSQIVYDTNMNSYASSKQKIEQALAAGKDVIIAWVYRDAIDALKNGALPRAERQAKEFGSGRTVPLEEHLKTHSGVAEVIPRLAAEYANDPRVQFLGIDNTKGKGKQELTDVAGLAKKAQNASVDVEKLRAALKGEYESGRISDATYRGFSGEVPDGGRAEANAPGRAGQLDRPDDGGKPEGSQPASGSAAEQVSPLLAAAQEAARLNPSLEVEIDVDGVPQRMTAGELLRAVQEQAAADIKDAGLLQVAAQCFITAAG